MGLLAGSVRIAFWLPGSSETASGGYEYDRQLARALTLQGHQVSLVDLSLGIPREAPWDIVIQDELGHRLLAPVNRPWKAEHRLPIVALVHHLRCLEPRPAIDNFFVRRDERNYLRTVDGFLFNSEDTRRSVEQLLNNRTSRPWLVQKPGFESVPRVAQRMVQTAEPVRLLSLGSITQRKGQIATAKALSGLKHLSWSWTIAGPDQDEPQTTERLKFLVNRYRIADRTVFTGYIDQTQRDALWVESDVFVLPSEYEGFGMAAMEASAHGLPVIAGSRGGIREVIKDGITGYLASDPGSLRRALEALIGDGPLRAALGSAGKRRAASLPTWEQTFARAGDFLQSIGASDLRPHD